MAPSDPRSELEHDVDFEREDDAVLPDSERAIDVTDDLDDDLDSLDVPLETPVADLIDQRRAAPLDNEHDDEL